MDDDDKKSFIQPAYQQHLNLDLFLEHKDVHCNAINDADGCIDLDRLVSPYEFIGLPWF